MRLKLIIIGILTMAAFASCSEQEAQPQPIPQFDDDKIDVCFSISGGDVMSYQTKMTANIDESAVGRYQILVFNSNGKLDGYGESMSSGNLSVRVTRGAGKHCYAVVNSMQELSLYVNEEDFLGIYSELDSAPSNIEMIGMVEKDLTVSTTCQIPVSRFVAKVILDKITVDFSKIPVYWESGLNIKGIYLINVRRTCPYSLVQTEGTHDYDWYNPLAFEYGFKGLIGDEDMNAWASNESPYTTPHHFYCMPNPVEDDVQGGDTFSPRCTRLVIEAKLAGETYYYPINITGADGTLHANTSYEITNLKITGIGSDSPDIVPKKGNVSFSVKVTDWTTGFSKEVEY